MYFFFPVSISPERHNHLPSPSIMADLNRQPTSTSTSHDTFQTHARPVSLPIFPFFASLSPRIRQLLAATINLTCANLSISITSPPLFPTSGPPISQPQPALPSAGPPHLGTIFVPSWYHVILTIPAAGSRTRLRLIHLSPQSPTNREQGEGGGRAPQGACANLH